MANDISIVVHIG